MSEDVRFRVLSYLTDQRDGKPKQQVDVSGGLMHAHTIYRDPRLAALTPDELQSLDSLTRKLLPIAQDGPHNQIESNAVTEPKDAVESPSDEPTATSNVVHEVRHSGP